MVEKVKNMFKKIIVLIIILQISFIPISNAGFWDDVKNSGDAFINDGQNQASSSNGPGVDQDDVDALMNQIYNALLILGVVLSVLIGAVLGIKFMIGSVEEQAKIKEMLLPYVSGCIVTFGAFGIWKLLIVILGKL